MNLQKIKSALVSGVLTAILAGAGYVLSVGDIFKVDVHSLSNVLALSLLTAIVSLIKSFSTTNEGNFIGVVSVAPPARD